jgi:tetratricopeptide (TPR) repeat protein
VTTEASIEPDEWQLGVRAVAADPEGWAIQTAFRITQTRTRPMAEIGEEYANSVYWMRRLATAPTIVSPDLLSAFVEELGRLAGNLGQPSRMDDVEAALRDAVDAQSAVGGSVSDLYLALASYLGTQAAETRERGRAIAAAVANAEPGTDEWGTAMIAKCAYEVSISRYTAAIRTAHRLRAGVERGVDPLFECGALTHEGTALFTSFQDLAEAERLLQRAVTFAPAARTDVRVARWLATAFHYLGRIAEAQGDDAECLRYYLRGQEYQELCPEEIEANAFLQLRLSEPLANANLFELASDHLSQAERLASMGANRGSAAVQVDIGHATLLAKQGQLAAAQQKGREALRHCREIGFRRGELLCLGFLFTIRVKRGHYVRAALTLLRIVPTLLTGELRRNSILKLRSSIPVLFRLAFRRLARAGTRGGARPGVTELTGCPCPQHVGLP